MISKSDSLREVLDAFQYGGYTFGVNDLTALLPVHENESISSAVARLQCCYPKGSLPPRGRRRWLRIRRWSRRNHPKLVRAIDSFLEWVDEQFFRTAAVNEPQIVDDDGLHEFGFRLVWGGTTYDLQPQVWRTLRYFWDRRGAGQDAFEEDLWGDAVEHATVRKAVQRANVILEKAEVGWVLELRNGQIRKSQLADARDQVVTARSQ
jgi:hypothetical protein